MLGRRVENLWKYMKSNVDLGINVRVMNHASHKSSKFVLESLSSRLQWQIKHNDIYPLELCRIPFVVNNVTSQGTP